MSEKERAICITEQLYIIGTFTFSLEDLFVLITGEGTIKDEKKRQAFQNQLQLRTVAHFALSWCCSSSPPMCTFLNPELLDQQLDVCCSEFLLEQIRLDPSTHTLVFPKLFLDSTMLQNKADIVQFALKHMPDSTVKDGILDYWEMQQTAEDIMLQIKHHVFQFDFMIKERLF